MLVEAVAALIKMALVVPEVQVAVQMALEVILPQQQLRQTQVAVAVAEDITQLVLMVPQAAPVS